MMCMKIVRMFINFTKKMLRVSRVIQKITSRSRSCLDRSTPPSSPPTPFLQCSLSFITPPPPSLHLLHRFSALILALISHSLPIFLSSILPLNLYLRISLCLSPSPHALSLPSISFYLLQSLPTFPSFPLNPMSRYIFATVFFCLVRGKEPKEEQSRGGELSWNMEHYFSILTVETLLISMNFRSQQTRNIPFNHVKKFTVRKRRIH